MLWPNKGVKLLVDESLCLWPGESINRMRFLGRFRKGTGGECFMLPAGGR